MEIIKTAFLDGAAFAVKVGSFLLFLLLFVALISMILGIIAYFCGGEDDDMNEV